MGIPQILMIVIIAMGLGISMVEHGTPKTGKNNFFVSLIAYAIEIALLYFGGFF